MAIITLLAAFLSGIFFMAARDVEDNPSNKPNVDSCFQWFFAGLGVVMAFCTFASFCLIFA